MKAVKKEAGFTQVRSAGGWARTATKVRGKARSAHRASGVEDHQAEGRSQKAELGESQERIVGESREGDRRKTSWTFSRKVVRSRLACTDCEHYGAKVL
jgi:hypothetical protein